MDKCPYCESYFFKYSDDPLVRYEQYQDEQIPYYCTQCGKPFPWIENILEDAAEIIDVEELLTYEQKEILKNELPNLIIESPRSGLSATKTKKILRDKEFIFDAFWHLIKDYSPAIVRSIMTAAEKRKP